MKKTQKQMVLNYLKNHVGITSLTAIEKFGITRLSAVIFELKEEGNNILSLPKDVKNRYGQKCRVAEYRLVK